MEFPLNTLGVAHAVIARHVRPGAFCIDATAGRGRDTAFLCGLVGQTGRVLSMDIQKEAVESTKELIKETGYESIATVIEENHKYLDRYALPQTVDCIVFNFGYLPGGDRTLFSKPENSIPAVSKGLTLLKPGGLMSLCIYYGGETGFSEKDALLSYLKTVDDNRYTVLVSEFYNRKNCPPIPVFIWKD